MKQIYLTKDESGAYFNLYLIKPNYKENFDKKEGDWLYFNQSIGRNCDWADWFNKDPRIRKMSSKDIIKLKVEVVS